VPLDKIDEVLFIQHLPKLWQEKVRELRANGLPDKTIAKMISQTQTAKKGETRAALMATAPGRPAPEPNATLKEDAGENVTFSWRQPCASLPLCGQKPRGLPAQTAARHRKLQEQRPDQYGLLGET
jgi:hypothetical protein